jgi:hypothetical protein
MNSLPSSVLNSSKSQTNKKLFASNDDGFKTSNSVIFPSLNPLGPLYKQRKQTRPNLAYKEHSEAAEVCKKQRLNTGFERIQPSQETVKLLEKKVESPNRIGTTFDRDVFRVPRLPKRLNTETNNNNIPGSEIKIPEVIKKPVVQKQESLAQENPTPREKDLQDLKESLAEFVREKRIENRISEFNSKNHDFPLYSNQDLNSGFVMFDLVDLNSLFERLNYEFYTLALRQNLEKIAHSQINLHSDEKQSKIEENMHKEAVFKNVDHNIFDKTKVEHVSS